MTPSVAERWLAFFEQHEQATVVCMIIVFWGALWILKLVEAARGKR